VIEPLLDPIKEFKIFTKKASKETFSTTCIFYIILSGNLTIQKNKRCHPCLIWLQILVEFLKTDQKNDALQNCLLKILDLIFMNGTTYIITIYKINYRILYAIVVYFLNSFLHRYLIL